MPLPRKKSSSTTSLPASLREELGLPDSQTNGRNDRAALFSQRRGGVLGRKEARKAQRQEKKVNRGQRQLRSQSNGHRSASGQSHDTKGKGKAADDRAPHERVNRDQPSSSKQRLGVESEVVTPLQSLMRRHAEKDDAVKRARYDQDEHAPERSKRSRTALTTTEKAEEDEIAWLEAHLGVGKWKSKKATEDVGPDGLDELLDDLDRFYPGMYDDTSRSEEEADSTRDYSDSREEDIDESSEDEESSFSAEGSDDSFEHGSDDRSSDPYEDDLQPPTDPAASETTASTGRYIPPALRKQMAASTNGDSVKLTRSLKGLLNRLGENNLDSIVIGLEQIYRDNSRAPTTSTLTELIMDTIASSENMTDSFVILYATVVAAMHRIVGIEFGAHFIEQLIERLLDRYMAEQRQEHSASQEVAKEPRSLAALLAALYSLDVCASTLMYDVVHLLLGRRDPKTGKELTDGQNVMTELDIEILLTIVKLCGPQLRHDDPTSLKQIVHLAQERQASLPSLRAKFMLESLSDLRNNRSRATTASVAVESTTKMRRYLGGLSKKHSVRTHEPLRVGLRDLRSADKRGKWWLIGAAWAGYDFNEKGLVKDDTNDAEEHQEQQQQQQSEQLQKLARQHGMNTLIRQQIFTTLMTSQDYLDAVQRLMSLTHKKTKQRREIVRVLLHCLGHEKSFNPFYVVIASRLTNEDQMGTRITLQYCLWDFLRRLGEQNVGGQSLVGESYDDDGQDADPEFDDLGAVSDATVNNTARAYGWWFANGSLALDALRAVDFTALRRSGQRFLRLTFVYLFLSVGITSPVQTLSEVRETDQSSRARDALEKILVQGTRTNRNVAKGLLVFLQNHLRANDCRAVGQELGLGKQSQDILVQRQSIALETIRVGVQMAGEFDKNT